jgi:hypothetical protein
MATEESLVRGLLRRVITIRHHGPGTHPGTGTDQTVHGGDGATVAEEARPEGVGHAPPGFQESDYGESHGVTWIWRPDGISAWGWSEKQRPRQPGSGGPAFWPPSAVHEAVRMLDAIAEQVRKGEITLSLAEHPVVRGVLRRVQFPETLLTTEGFSGKIKVRHLGPGDHPSGSPQTVHAGDGGGGKTEDERTRVGITAARPGMSTEQVRRQLRHLIGRLQGIETVKNVYATHALGTYRGGQEASYLIEYDGNGQARIAMAEFGLAQNQESVLMMEPPTGEGDTPMTDFGVNVRVSAEVRGELNVALGDAGLGYWTWFRQRGGGHSLRVACVPQYGGTPEGHGRDMEAVAAILADAGLDAQREDQDIHAGVLWRDQGEGRVTYGAVSGSTEGN